MVTFLVPHAIGCELWAPWSEELGRWPIMQALLGLTNISILVALSRATSKVLLVVGL
jgi:hypothetical protein